MAQQTFYHVADFIAEIWNTLVSLTPGWVNPPLSFGYGSAAIASAGTPPRVVFAPTTDEFKAPRPPGQQQSADETITARAIKSKLAWIECHLWGAAQPGIDPVIAGTTLYGYAQAEDLEHFLIQALQQNAAGNYVLKPAQWTKTGNETSGQEVIMHFGVLMPMLDQTWQTVEVTKEQVTPAVNIAGTVEDGQVFTMPP